MQWLCANLEDTHTRMVIPSPTGGVEEGLSVSMICVKDGEVGKFDYISEANLLGIMDMDDEEVAPVFIPFREVWKILPKDVFTPLDELQYLRKGEVTLDMVHEMMKELATCNLMTCTINRPILEQDLTKRNIHSS